MIDGAISFISQAYERFGSITCISNTGKLPFLKLPLVPNVILLFSKMFSCGAY
jgi:hypothetical protein